MRRYPIRQRWVWGIAAGLAVAAYLPWAGAVLVVNDQPAPAEALVVLSGGRLDRVLAALDLYQRGLSPRVVLIPEPPMPPATRLAQLGISIERSDELARRVLLAGGVAGQAILVLPRHVDGTIAEAREIRTLMESQGWSSVAVVTSKTPSRRACWIFRRVLSDRTVHCVASWHDPADPARWWRDPRTALRVLTEYQKLAVNMVSLALGLGR